MFNLVCIKIPKSASSTTCGIARRIAASTHISGAFDGGRWISKEPGLWANHASLAHLYPLMGTLRMRVFLFTFVREPSARCLSEYYHFDVSRKSASQSAAAKVAALSMCQNNMHNYTRREARDTPEALVRGVYSFEGVV